MSKLAIIIPTYNRAAHIKTILENELDIYYENGYELYIFDSSTEPETEYLVSEYQKRYINLYYFKFPKETHAMYKVFFAFLMCGRTIDCDYVWLRSDYICTDRLLLNKLKNSLGQGADLIVLNTLQREELGIVCTDDKVDIFCKYAWVLTWFGATIFNIKRFNQLEGINWGGIEEKYISTECKPFWHVGLYFEFLAKLNNPQILVFNIPDNLFYGNPKKQNSHWEDKFFRYMLESWPKTIYSLPEVYPGKLAAIRSFGKEAEFTYANLKHLRDIDEFNEDVFDRYREKIIRYSGVELDLFDKVMKNEKCFWADGDEYEKLNDFCKNYSKLVIYGAGKKALRYAEYLIYSNIKFEAFVVSQSTKNNDKLLEHDIISIGQYIFDDDTGIILGLNTKNQLEVYTDLKKRNLHNKLFSYPYDCDSLIKFIRDYF